MPPLPERIGLYRVLRELGRGGMGVVFEAEQENPRRTVALKVLSVGILGAELRRRFEREERGRAAELHPPDLQGSSRSRKFLNSTRAPSASSAT